MRNFVAIAQVAFLGFDHLDTRVPDIAAVEPFYDLLMPLLGLTHKRYALVNGDDWQEDPAGRHNTIGYIEENAAGRAPHFINFVEDKNMKPVMTRIAFRVAPSTDYDHWMRELDAIGARNVERCADMDAYPAIFFEDPCGTKLELCGRRAG